MNGGRTSGIKERFKLSQNMPFFSFQYCEMKKRQIIQSSIEDKFKEKYLGSKQEMILSRREILELIDYKQFLSS